VIKSVAPLGLGPHFPNTPLHRPQTIGIDFFFYSLKTISSTPHFHPEHNFNSILPESTAILFIIGKVAQHHHPRDN
jgi:hypothetical protein